jgi:cytochrome P450/NADPH-cytochrome P450 reductase
LLEHPDIAERARAEALAAFGSDPQAWPDFRAVNGLVYIKQVLKEALRLWPTAAVFAVTPLAETTLGGAYPAPKGAHIVCLVPALHRDAEVWGANADQFDPDRFTPEAEARLAPNAYKPFGNGKRQCIGRQFALHEAALILGLILQRFDLIGDPGYRLAIKETLTLKPEGLRMRVRPRPGFAVEPR